MAKLSKSPPKENDQHTYGFSRFWRRRQTTPTHRLQAHESCTLNTKSRPIRNIEGNGSSAVGQHANSPGRRKHHMMRARPPGGCTESPHHQQQFSNNQITNSSHSQFAQECHGMARSRRAENHQSSVRAHLTMPDRPFQARERSSQVQPLQGENRRPLGPSSPAEMSRPIRELNRRTRSHSQLAFPANDSGSAKNTYDLLLKWLTAKESQPTIVLLGMAGIAATGMVTYFASEHICVAATEIARVVSANGSEAIVGVAKVAAPAIAGMGAKMFLGTKLVWEVSDTIRGYVSGPSAKASSNARGFGRVLGEIEDSSPLVRGLLSPPRSSKRSGGSQPSTSLRRIGN